jgi:hypothetical protein
MDQIQGKHERTVGEAFIRWFNAKYGNQFKYDNRPHEAPDLRYMDGNQALNIEITGAYYDDRDDAAMQWKAARKEDDAPYGWSGRDFDRTLVSNIRNISAAIAKKCRKDYGKNCVLVVAVRPAITSDDEMEQMLSEIKIPEKTPFAGIYLTGEFPRTDSSRGGFRYWQLR